MEFVTPQAPPYNCMNYIQFSPSFPITFVTKKNLTFEQVAFVMDAFFVHYKKKDEDIAVSEAPVSKQLEVDYENAFSIVYDISCFL